MAENRKIPHQERKDRSTKAEIKSLWKEELFRKKFMKAKADLPEEKIQRKKKKILILKKKTKR